MRRGNLPDGGHDKITWKSIRDLLTRRRDNVTLRSGGDVPQRPYWVFHLGLTGEVVESCHQDVLVTCQRDVVGCFIWDLLETSWRRTDETLLLRPLRRRHDVPIRCRGDVPLWHLNDVPSRRHWVFHLRRTCDVTGTYRETSLRHRKDVLLPDGLVI